MNKIWISLFIIFSLIHSHLLYAFPFQMNDKIKDIFKAENIVGTFILYDTKNKQFTGYNKERASFYYSPASTFKIVNTLLALSTGTIESVDTIFYYYDGSPMFLEAWEENMTLRKAIKVSHLPAYQLIARSIGLKEMQKNISILQYGTIDIGKNIDTFWLDGSLQITAFEQITFLEKLVKKELPYSKEYQELVAEISRLENGENWILYGKTGWATNSKNPSIGWFIGWVKQDGNSYIFAMNMDIYTMSMLSKREEIVKKSLDILGLLK